MGIFQKSVINNHLANLDKELVNKAFEKFTENYSPKKIAEIKNLKEEEYQDGFLRDIFVDVFGYTLKPAENYNLVREFKNQTDGKKADGAILNPDKKLGEKAIVVIELKSTKTKDLKSITEQAFNYKNNQPGCKYVITSNFRKLRFYIDYANEYEEFDLFNLQKQGFELLYLILHKDSIFADLPLELKNETKFHEENISDKLYKDYSGFKHKIYTNLVKNNPQYDKLTLFKKSQKFLDRLLFVFFAEDTGLVPPNAISKIVEQWETLKELDEYKTLYSRFVKFFEHLDKGHKYKTYELPAYNGGLFAPDEILDNITIDDEILKGDALKLSAYDFNTDVDVNILGHIFEHSLGEIEEITAKIEGTATEKEKSRRKKDGVFYTPKYITQYIVENTIGRLCNEKRDELNITEIEFDGTYKTKDGKLSAKGKKLFKTIDEYKSWLLTLKIIDPACGSGAFLNQALSFLIEEHKHIDDILAELTGEALRLFDTDKAILENNLYGVDINEESVEIARLSLWLRTAQKGRKLSNLNQNIKCGNSLIDDPEIAGDKAFDWNKEFPEIMQNGGFDVVIGNPPYVRIQGLKENYKKESEFYEQNYKSATANYDIYALFIEKAFKLIKKNGNVCFIQPHKFLISDFGIGIRSFLLENNAVEQLLHFGSNMVFQDASTYTCILKLSYNNKEIKFRHVEPEKINSITNFDTISYDKLSPDKWNLTNNNIAKVLDKLKQQPLTVKDVFAKIFQGIATSGDKVYLIKGEEKNGFVVGYSQQLDKTVSIEKELLKPMLKGEDISKYKHLKNKYWVIFPYLLNDGKAEAMTEDYIKNNFQKGYEYLKENETFLCGREHHRFDNDKEWFLFGRKQGISNVEQEKIITPDISLGSNMTFDEGKFYHGTTLYSFIKKQEIKEDYKFYLSILNSSILWFFIKNTGTELRGGYFRFKTNYLNPFPLPKLKHNIEQQPFIEKANQMLDLNKTLQEKRAKILNRLRDNFDIEKLSKKLEAFYDYDFKTFVSELKKKKIKLSLVQQDEWEDYFNAYKTEINHLQSQINQTDKEIDQMVYELYGLTENEIKIVEEAV